MRSREEIIRYAREALGLSESVSVDVFPFGGRGSDRSFFRLKWNVENSVILIHYDPHRVENRYYADIAVFLQEIHVPVPRLIHHDPARYLVLLEDLGDIDLWSLREAPWPTRKVLYQKTLGAVHRLHSFPEENFPSDRITLMKGFDLDLYQWERNYFRDHLVRDVCGIELVSSLTKELESELARLAEKLIKTKRSLVHRDLQSQNVMIFKGEPYLIDFQGMRFGSLFYDLGSLLCDPYVNLSGDEQEALLSFAYGLSNRDMDWGAFRNTFWEASAQRLMQALGAYGFLGRKKGLTAFLEHISAGLQHLLHVASEAPSLPRLRDLAAECQQAYGQKRI
jgi:aminoglycoside/choline kinase family phosphotransferase